jgi:hypothetical protein
MATQSTFAEIGDALRKHQRFAILSHVRPDGDALRHQSQMRRTYFNESELIYPSAPPAMTWVQPSALSSVITFVPTPMVLSTCESAPGAERISVFGSDTVIWLVVCSALGFMSAGWGTLNGGGKACKEVF